MAGEIIAHFEILEKLGEGGMGVVYKARDTLLGRFVALKFLPQESSDSAQSTRRFLREAQAASALNHPNIITIYEIGDDGGRDYIAMEFVEGATLEALIGDGPIQVSEALGFATQIASALAAAHVAGIVHRDLKPGNVMVTRAGFVKVLDFGLAKVSTTGPTGDATQSLHVRTQEGVILGTVAYMSPEQAEGRHVDARSDIFAFGALLYEMLSGHRVFQGRSAIATLAAVLREEPVPLRQVAPGVPPELEKVVAHCLEKDPALRYQHGGKLEAVLRSVPHQSGALIKEQRDAGDERRTLAIRGLSRRHIPAIIIALLVVTVIAGYLLRDRILRPRALAPERITLAVLPFRPLTAPEQIGFLGIGIPDAIINRLANVGRMRLRPTSAILRYQNQNVDAQQAGSALATNYVLSGTVMRVTDRFRVSVQLVRVADGATLWGQHFDLAQEDLLGLQDVIAERIVAVLRVQVTAAERQRLHHRYTENAAAYRIYLEGRSDLLQYTEQGARSAVAAFEAALRLDRNYVLARSGLAVACAKMSIRFAPEGEIQIWRQRAEAEAKQAIELDEDLGEAHEALAEVYRSVEFDWDGTIRESRRALELNPNLEMPHYYLAAAFYHLGLLEQVEPEARAGLEINPENRVEPLRVRAVAALFGGKYADAQALLIELQPLSASSFSDLYLAQARYYQGARFQAEAILSKSYTSGQAERRSPAALASFLAARGEKARAEALVKTIIAGTYMDHHVSYSLGVTYAQLHDAPNARRWLARAAETGLPCYPWFARDPLLQPLRGDAEFQKFMDGLRLSWEHAKARYTA